MSGKLYLCATPIGNLEDITLRVLHTLKEVDLIAAEDTRNSIKLLNHFEIKTPMTSYHEYNKIEKGLYLINLLLEGKNIALISDAGTPGISDPGEELVRMCYERRIPVTSLPGPCALVTALTLSGLSAKRFCFEGFLPADKKEKQFILEEIKKETRTVVLYEAPHHLVQTLELLSETLGSRKICILKELSKRYETVFLSTVEEALVHYGENPPKGEYVLVLEGLDRELVKQEERDKWSELTLQEHMEYYFEKNLDKKAAMKCVAKDRGLSKRDVYRQLLED